MSWLNFIDEVFLVNLAKREDRLFESAKLMEESNIPYKIFPAIEKPNGAEGLRDTMVLLFEEILSKGYKNVLVFEDDIKLVLEPFWFHDTLNKVCEQLPENYHTCNLGPQLTTIPSHYHSTNVINVQKAFNTQSMIYSKQGIKEIMSRGMGFPIDTWFVENIQILGHSYCSFPLVCSQRAGFSDIGKNEINWGPFIEGRFQQKVNEMKRSGR